MREIKPSSKSADRLGERLTARSRQLTPSLRRVAEYINANRQDAVTMSATELGHAIGTSDATVVRAVQALGFAGLRELKRSLASATGRGVTPADNMGRTLALIENANAAVGHVLRTHQEAVSQLTSEAILARIAEAIAVLADAKRIAFYGIGPTAALAQYAHFVFGRNGRPGILLQASGSTLADHLLDLESASAVLMLAYGTAYPEAEATILEARRCRIPIVLISDSLDERLARRADVIVPVARGLSGNVALHGATFVCLEAILMGVVARDQPKAMATLNRLNDLRQIVLGRRRSVV
jgi:DNA-binding MurR/RpiR family transcriptional regulator